MNKPQIFFNNKDSFNDLFKNREYLPLFHYTNSNIPKAQTNAPDKICKKEIISWQWLLKNVKHSTDAPNPPLSRDTKRGDEFE